MSVEVRGRFFCFVESPSLNRDNRIRGTPWAPESVPLDGVQKCYKYDSGLKRFLHSVNNSVLTPTTDGVLMRPGALLKRSTSAGSVAKK